MIIAFVGLPGSGKSYDVVREITRNLAVRRRVYTNVEGMEDPQCQRMLQDIVGLDDGEFRSLFHWLPDSEIQHFWRLKKITEFQGTTVSSPLVEDGSLIVIDEVHKLFSSRRWQSKENNEFADWASTHRHHGFDCYIVTQDLRKIDSHLRSLVHWTYIYRKVSFIGSLSKNRYIKYSYESDDTRGKPLATITRTYDLKIFKCYKSMTNDTNVKLNIMPQVNILKHPVFFLIPCLFALFCYMFFGKSSFSSGDIFGTKQISRKHDRPVISSAASSSASSAPVAPVSSPVTPIVSQPLSVSSPGVSPASLPGHHVPGQYVSGASSLPSSSSFSFGAPQVSPNVVVGVISDGAVYHYLLSGGRTVSSPRRYSLGSEFPVDS